MHGDINQLSRNRRLADFRSGRKPILIATDVAARGIDIPNVQLIIQYNSPQNVDAYIHRSGRTGRAGREGVCVSLINPFLSQER
ncbi:UNVERIFIED_CONTAM: hypothetical protein GTU68_034329 [Idotea baltica]|nr:hypothetical protein [Idotea baltica]